ncbi:MAG: hypothetical protein JKP95_04260 [Oceanicaulis sp.]|nr:hypothetical protein [Oceanicaulis sp.]
MLVLGLGAALYAAVTIDLSHAWASGLDMLFAITTTGYQTASQPVLPLTLLVLLAMAGGSTISTSGGIKMPRILLLLRRAGGELSSLSHPSAAVRTRFIGRPVSDSALTGVWVYALAYPAALGLGAVALGMTGASFHDSWAVLRHHWSMRAPWQALILLRFPLPRLRFPPPSWCWGALKFWPRRPPFT